jgi:hypothetical protein
MSEDLVSALRDLEAAERGAVEAASPDPSAIGRHLARRVARRRAVRTGGTLAAGLVLVGGAAVGVQALDRPALPSAPGPSATTSPTTSPTAPPLVDASTFEDTDPVVRFSLLVTAITDAYPDDFATAVYADPISPAGWIGFAGAVPPAAQAAIDTLPGVLAVPDLGYTQQETVALTRALMDLAPAEATAAGQVASWAEGPGTDLVLVYQETEPGTSAADERRAAVDAAVQRLMAEHPAYTVTVRTSTEQVMSAESWLTTGSEPSP